MKAFALLSQRRWLRQRQRRTPGCICDQCWLYGISFRSITRTIKNYNLRFMQQLNLFAESTPVLPITYYPDFLSLEQANELYQHCLKLEWQQNQIRIAGKTMPVPRLECIYGDAGCDYFYSNSVFLKPLTWTDALANLRDRITALTGYKFRIVIGNQYRTGTDSIGWHSDNEPSMGFNPAIVSVSLGSCRKFQIKPIGGKATDFWLEHGSLLVMHPGCQPTHLHQVPKTNKVVSTRINLTFRPHTTAKSR